MKRAYIFAAVLFTVGFILLSGDARAQLAQEVDYPDQKRVDVSLNSGVLFAEQELVAAGILGDVENIFVSLDSGNMEMTFGITGDVVYRFDSGLRFGGQLGWSPMTIDFDVVEIDGQPIRVGQDRELDLYLYSLTVGYTAGISRRVGVFGSVGLGGATQAFENEELLVNGEDIYNNNRNTSFQTPLTIGARYALTRSIALDVLARDNLIFGNDALGGTTNNLYIGGGISYMF